jgi:hypothetical protein
MQACVYVLVLSDVRAYVLLARKKRKIIDLFWQQQSGGCCCCLLIIIRDPAIPFLLFRPRPPAPI